jgi:hypothetical protein
MADQINHPNRPATDYERQQARLIAEFNAKQDSKEQLATDLKSQFSETFERSADIALDRLGNEYNRELAVDNIASILAENNIPRPDLMGSENFRRVVENAAGAALDTEHKELQQWQKPTPPLLEAAPEPQGTLDNPGVEADGPERKIGTYADLTREHSEIVARLEAGEDLDVGGSGAGEKKLNFFEDRVPENAPAIGNGSERADAAAEPGEKHLHFFGELKQEQANATGKENDRSESAEQEQSDVGEKKLSFFEDRNPTSEHGMEH